MRRSAEIKATSSPVFDRQKGEFYHWIEIVSAVLISLATVISAWCAYQSALWAGEVMSSYNLANAARTESVRMSNRALQLTTIDVNLFSAYVSAYSKGDDDLADFFMARFRPEMKLAVDAWIKTRPLINPEAPYSPFNMAEYQSEAQLEADRLLFVVDEYLELASKANERSGRYFLLTVIFASILFFGGISSKFRSINIQIGLLTFSTLMFLITVIFVMTFPIL
jgi:hypothetical protein